LPKFNFEELLLESVDEGLSALGESSKQAIYFHIEKGFNIKKNEIPGNIADFDRAIEKIFGLGASFLETLILKRLIEKTNLTNKQDTFKREDFAETVTALKQAMEL
jgi:hypothetical protein